VCIKLTSIIRSGPVRGAGLAVCDGGPAGLGDGLAGEEFGAAPGHEDPGIDG
jgi:hypothetical protein